MSKKIFGHVAAAAFGTIAGIAAVALTGAAIGLYKWSKDEDSDCVRVVIGGKGIRISKTGEPSKFQVETNYDWKSDPDFCDCENCDCEECECEEDGCCKEKEDCCCRCVEVEEEKTEEADADPVQAEEN